MWLQATVLGMLHMLAGCWERRCCWTSLDARTFVPAQAVKASASARHGWQHDPSNRPHLPSSISYRAAPSGACEEPPSPAAGRPTLLRSACSSGSASSCPADIPRAAPPRTRISTCCCSGPAGGGSGESGGPSGPPPPAAELRSAAPDAAGWSRPPSRGCPCAGSACSPSSCCLGAKAALMWRRRPKARSRKASSSTTWAQQVGMGVWHPPAPVSRTHSSLWSPRPRQQQQQQQPGFLEPASVQICSRPPPHRHPPAARCGRPGGAPAASAGGTRRRAAASTAAARAPGGRSAAGQGVFVQYNTVLSWWLRSIVTQSGSDSTHSISMLNLCQPASPTSHHPERLAVGVRPCRRTPWQRPTCAPGCRRRSCLPGLTPPCAPLR